MAQAVEKSEYSTVCAVFKGATALVSIVNFPTGESRQSSRPTRVLHTPVAVLYEL